MGMGMHTKRMGESKNTNYVNYSDFLFILFKIIKKSLVFATSLSFNVVNRETVSSGGA